MTDQSRIKRIYSRSIIDSEQVDRHPNEYVRYIQEKQLHEMAKMIVDKCGRFDTRFVYHNYNTKDRMYLDKRDDKVMRRLGYHFEGQETTVSLMVVFNEGEKDEVRHES